MQRGFIDSLWKQNLYLGSGEILTSCEYDENGNLTEVRIEEGSRETTFFYEWVKLPNR